MKKIHLAFLWHQHQPQYKNPSTNMYELPWVRLHATKDYYDMAQILEGFPKIKSNFNLVPSLIVQLEDYASGNARDRYLDLTLKDAGEITQDEKIFILQNFFKANWETMVFPHNRYHQLLEKRGRQTCLDEIKRTLSYFTVTDVRDLQVWFNLAWMDPYWIKNDPLVRSLFNKSRDFSENDKQLLIQKQREICGLVVGKHKELQDRGQIEVTTTPFYHPILPLLCDSNIASEAIPSLTLPKKTFRHPEDAKAQVQKAVEFYTKRFGRSPRGMWPSEGSVSEEIIPILSEAGIKWIATDEEILFRSHPSLKKGRDLFKPYRLDINGNNVDIIFRDHGLSDAIGFVYSRWNAKDAVADFMHKIQILKNALKDSAEGNLVSIILDGENCWEFYRNDGHDFLNLLYQAISDDPEIETVTVADYLEKNPPKETLKKLWPGSWINGNFGIWIGHPEDNLAWEFIEETRNFIVDFINGRPDMKDSNEVKSAWENLYAAEGSDWTWWYGEDHSSGDDQTFDFLFRQHLISIYEVLGQKVPDHLYKAIKKIIRKGPDIEPNSFITPKIDGLDSNYFEWQNAGYYSVGHAGGSMHQVETVLKSFHYGFDLENLYFRLDLSTPINSKLIEELSFNIIFLGNIKAEASLTLKIGGKTNNFDLTSGPDKIPLTTVAANKIIEMEIPLKDLKVPESVKTVEFAIVIRKNGLEIERWPYQSSVTMPKPTEEFSLQKWSV